MITLLDLRYSYSPVLVLVVGAVVERAGRWVYLSLTFVDLIAALIPGCPAFTTGCLRLVPRVVTIRYVEPALAWRMAVVDLLQPLICIWWTLSPHGWTLCTFVVPTALLFPTRYRHYPRLRLVNIQLPVYVVDYLPPRDLLPRSERLVLLLWAIYVAG